MWLRLWRSPCLHCTPVLGVVWHLARACVWAFLMWGTSDWRVSLGRLCVWLCVAAGVWAGAAAASGGDFSPCQPEAWTGARGGAGLLGVRACVLVVLGPEAGLLTVWAVESQRFARRGKFFIPESALWLPATQRSLFPLRESRAPRGSLEGLQTNNPLLDENLCPCAGPTSWVLSSDPVPHLVSLMQREREPLWHRGLHLGYCGDLATHLAVLLPSWGVVWVGLPGAG